MDAKVSAFLMKFIAALYIRGFKSFPFSGDGFQDGIASMEAFLRRTLPKTIFRSISEAFIKSPVQERYNLIRDLIMDLNGNGIGFTAIDNPYWKIASIKMNSRYAENILNDKNDLDIDSTVMENAADAFCSEACPE